MRRFDKGCVLHSEYSYGLLIHSMKERDLELSRSDATSAQQKANELATRLRDLQEQIEADDRAEKLEASLKGLQSRADSLESQLARVKQASRYTRLCLNISDTP